MNVNFKIIIQTNHWPRRIKKINKIIDIITKQKKILEFDNKVNYYCNIALINDSIIRKFNKLYRKSNKTTDVLTFISNLKKNRVIEKHCDIMISAETVLKDAKESNKNFYDHFAHLIIHSLLHINGYNHNNNNNFILMKNKEIKILNKMGISNPYL